jgi:hypothetical protein
MPELMSLRLCLQMAFLDSEASPQDDQQRWAIEEGLRRIDPLQAQWRGVEARKNHTCVRGCAIKDGEVYFQKRHGNTGGWGDNLKFCAGCTAMILFCRDVDRLPPTYFTHWDPEKKMPVNVLEKH